MFVKKFILVMSLIISALLVGCTDGKSTPVPKVESGDVWTLIADFIRTSPHSVESFEKTVGVQVNRTRSNPYRYESDENVTGAYGVKLAKATVAVNKAWLFSFIGLAPGGCLSVEQVQARYPGISMSDQSTGEDPVPTFSLSRPEGTSTLTFTFLYKSRCLNLVGIEPSTKLTYPS